MLCLAADGHLLGTSCVNLAEVEAGLRSRERRRAAAVLSRLRLLATDRDAAHRAGRYQADWSRRGRTISTPDALVAGTARAQRSSSPATPTTSRWVTCASRTRPPWARKPRSEAGVCLPKGRKFRAVRSSGWESSEVTA